MIEKKKVQLKNQLTKNLRLMFANILICTIVSSLVLLF